MAMQTWEYRVVAIDRDEGAEAELSRLGAEGWELVAVSDRSLAYLKRPALPFKEQVTLDQRAKYAAQRGDTLDDPSSTGQEG